MTKEFNVVIEKDEDGYFVASVPALRGCHTQAKSLDVLMKRVKEAIELCLEVENPVSNQFVGVQRVMSWHEHISHTQRRPTPQGASPPWF